MMKKYSITIAGNMGVGKSTLTQLLAKELNWSPFLEAVDDNPFLEKFFQDMNRWSFHSQVFPLPTVSHSSRNGPASRLGHSRPQRL